MKELYNLGITDEKIKEMLNINPNLYTIREVEVIEKERLLEFIGCTNNQALNIIVTNPLYLNKSNKSIVSLITLLANIGFKSLNILFDSNPFIFNIEEYELKKYLIEEMAKGKKLDEIVDNLDSNPYLFNEI